MDLDLVRQLARDSYQGKFRISTRARMSQTMTRREYLVLGVLPHVKTNMGRAVIDRFIYLTVRLVVVHKSCSIDLGSRRRQFYKLILGR